MKYYILISILLSSYICFSCNEKAEQKNGIFITVDISQRNKVSFGDIFESMDPIILETTENSLIRDITKVYLSDSSIYVYDKYRLGKLLLFDNKGRFLKKIGERGEGPKEFLDISDIVVNFEKESIWILSAMGNKLFVYSLLGEFIEIINLPEIDGGAYQMMTFIDKDNIAFWCADPIKKIKYYSLQDKHIFYEFYTELSRDIFCRYEFQMEKSFCRGLTNTIYALNKDEATPLYVWDFGENNNNVEKLKYPNYSDFNQVRSFAEDVHSSRIVNYTMLLHGKNENYIYTQLYMKNTPYNLFFNTKNRKSIIFEKTTEGAYLYPIYWANEYMVGLAIPSLEEMIPEQLQTKEIKEKIDKLTDESNPILIKYNFKQ